MPKNTHKDVEFHVQTQVYKTFKEACFHAVSRASCGEADITIDIVIWSKAGARWWGGDDAVTAYQEDSEASVFERLEISVNNVGRVS